MDVIDAKDRFLARMSPERAASAQADVELEEAQRWAFFEDKLMQRIIELVLRVTTAHQCPATLRAAYEIACDLTGRRVPPCPDLPLTSPR